MKDMGEWSWQQNPFVGHAAVPGAARDPADVQQLGSEELEQHRCTRCSGADGPIGGTSCATSATALGRNRTLRPKRNNLERLRADSGSSPASTDGFVEVRVSRAARRSWSSDRITRGDVAVGQCRSSEASASGSGRTRSAPAATRRTSRERFIRMLRGSIAEAQRIGSASVAESAVSG